MKKHWVLNYILSAQWRLWSDWVDTEADLSLRWAHMSNCWFCRAVAHLYLFLIVRDKLLVIFRLVWWPSNWKWAGPLGFSRFSFGHERNHISEWSSSFLAWCQNLIQFAAFHFCKSRFQITPGSEWNQIILAFVSVLFRIRIASLGRESWSICYCCICLFILHNMSRDITIPTKWLCAQRRLRSAWASTQSDQSLRCALNG